MLKFKKLFLLAALTQLTACAGFQAAVTGFESKVAADKLQADVTVVHTTVWTLCQVPVAALATLTQPELSAIMAVCVSKDANTQAANIINSAGVK